MGPAARVGDAAHARVARIARKPDSRPTGAPVTRHKIRKILALCAGEARALLAEAQQTFDAAGTDIEAVDIAHARLQAAKANYVRALELYLQASEVCEGTNVEAQLAISRELVARFGRHVEVPSAERSAAE